MIMLRAKHTKRAEPKKYPQLNIRMSAEAFAEVRRVADLHGASMAWVVNRCVLMALPWVEVGKKGN
jgi:DNA transposition AAA+ family ATPase